ncbi:MAG TPA: PAS domain-containing sensor histidine kinase [Bacteroidota bacterium]
MQTPGPEFWWAIGAGTLALVLVVIAFLATAIVSQRRLRLQLEKTQVSEAKYRGLFDSSLVGMIRIGIPGFLIIDSNRTFLELMGKDSLQGVRLYFQSARNVDLRMLETTILHKGGLENAEMEIPREDGSVIWISLTCRLHRAEGFAEGVAIDITERKEAEDRLRDSHQQLRNLSARLELIREEERIRIARQVHDELGQILTGVKIHLTVMTDTVALRDQKGKAKVLQKLETLIDIIDDAIDLVKNISYDLRPLVLEDLGLKEAIEWEATKFGQKTGIRCMVDSQGDFSLGREQATAVFRIFQEALTNVARHALASVVTVRLSSKRGSFLLEIIDDGKGITEDQVASQRALGILGMKERAMFLGGELRVSQNNGRGTAVGLVVPMAVSPNGIKDGDKNLHS